MSDHFGFFLLGPIPANAMSGTYNITLVLMSYMVAVLASFVALDFAGRMRSEINKRIQWYWLIGGAATLGTGIWSMHFIGMLAFKMPMPMTYNFMWTALSLLVAIIASGLAFFLLRSPKVPKALFIFGGILVGLAIVTMHYMGMEAMKNITMPKIMYTPGLFALSIFIAIIASEGALWLAIKSNQGAFKKQIQLKLMSSLVMGAAICGMHYTGMAAAVFIPGSESMGIHAIHSNDLAYYIAILIGFTLFTALVILTYQQLVKEMFFREQIASARDQIELKVIYRTRELQQALDQKNDLQNTLIHAEKMATVGQLAAGIAHEINNPLSYALGNMGVFHELLADMYNKQDAALIQDIDDLIAESQEGLLRIKKIVNDLISFSSNANEEEEEEEVNLNDCLESAICIIWNELKYKSTLHKNFAIVPKIKGFQNQLISIFMNILLNAAQAINEKGDIFITTALHDKSIIITISDTGCGILPEHLSQIFTPFFTTKSVGSAKGLGLATAYNMVRKHGGTLLAKSTIGKGSIFTVQLPVNN